MYSDVQKIVKKLLRKNFELRHRPRYVKTRSSAMAEGPRDAASRKIDHIALPTKYNYQATSVG